ncbi:MAG: Zn-ribbon domain-containing OB-fold protein [Actinomycetota bacterium]|nr:Zn-ribbon domain-containing OB-fold protein [Actinomycetota bacterium]
MSDARPVAAADSQTQSWWDATRESRLLVQHCRACGHHQHYPRALCTECGSLDIEDVEASGRGTVYSFTVVHRAPHPAFTPPYVVALVRLEEGPVLLSNIVGADHGDVRCDVRVKVAWEDLPDGRKLPVFSLES